MVSILKFIFRWVYAYVYVSGVRRERFRQIGTHRFGKGCTVLAAFDLI